MIGAESSHIVAKHQTTGRRGSVPTVALEKRASDTSFKSPRALRNYASGSK